MPSAAHACPFSFTYNGRPSSSFLATWSAEDLFPCSPDPEVSRTATVWREPGGGLSVTCHHVCYTRFHASEWLLTFSNSGVADTCIVSDVRALDCTIQRRTDANNPFFLHRTNGAPADSTDFQPRVQIVDEAHPQLLSARGGRSSNGDFPFFKIRQADLSVIIAVGWSGQWNTRLVCYDGLRLRVTAGMQTTHFRLHPGETVRSPRILVLEWTGPTQESNALFRRLVYRHYCAPRAGRPPLPALYCNACFTRGGAWLNECNASNQISLIRAYASLGLEAMVTDAGWFEGGWPDGAGNWTPRRDAYPDGMGPVAAEAFEHRIAYGLWFEPERVVAGTDMWTRHPGWVLRAPHDNTTGLANFGLPEVREYFLGILRSFMQLPGFRFYRQDFNMDPLAYWEHNDAPDRQGISEIRHIEGLYAYWDRIASEWPDSLREECAAGGRRIDLETVMRMHIHQDSDYWFDNETDRDQAWGLSQYLPNNCFSTPLVRMDDDSFYSTMAGSLCLGWIADDTGFDTGRARLLTGRYLRLRHLLVGAWYPLDLCDAQTSDVRASYTEESLEAARSGASTGWMGSQYHRPDLNEGFALVFRRPGSAASTMTLRLQALVEATLYRIAFESAGETRHVTGTQLTAGIQLTLSRCPGSELIHYKPAENGQLP